MIEIRTPATPADIDTVRQLWRRYWDDLGFTPCFQGFEDELAALPGKYAPPGGQLLLATHEGQTVGAVAYRRFDDEACEVKRLYVDPSARGHQLGEQLLHCLMEEARAAGYKRMIGDTLPVMAAALRLYHRLGFRRTAPYPGATPDGIYIEYILHPSHS